jgi:outer membrane protein assembly factor BamB
MCLYPLPHRRSGRDNQAGALRLAISVGALLVAARVLAGEPRDEAAGRAAIAKTGDFPKGTPLTKPEVLWKYTVKRPAANNNRRANPNAGIGVTDPVYFDGALYIGDDAGTVHALRADDGLPLWQTEGKVRIFHSPFVDADGVYCTSEPLGVIALNRRDGTRRWQTHVDRPGAPLKAGQTLFVAGGDGVVYAFDSATGDVRWERNYLDGLVDPPGFDGKRARFDRSQARPSNCASDGETFFQSVFDQCRVVALDCETGRQRWSFQSQGWIHGNAAVTDSFVVVGSQDDHCYCLNKKTGIVVWKFGTGSRIESGPAVRGDAVFIPSCDGFLYCVDLKSGEARWKFRTTPEPQGNSAIYSAPLLIRDAVCFAAGDGQLYAVKVDNGELLWKIRPSENSEMYSSPATDGRRIFVQVRTSDGKGENAVIAIDEAPEP